MKKLFLRWKYKLPRKKYDVWWNRSLHSSNRKFPIVQWENIGYLDCREDLVVPMEEVKEGVYAYYKVTKVSYRNADWLYNSDGYKCDMVFEGIHKGLGIGNYKENTDKPRFITM